MKKNILTYVLTYLRNNNNNNNNNNTNNTIQGHTTQLVYNKKDWKKFQHILSFESTNTNRFFWGIVELVLEQFDQKEHSLDKYLSEIELVTPNINTDPDKVLKYLQSLPMEKVKELEEKLMRDYIYIKAITQGEIELDNFPYLWRKYN
jgi:hypothetical protein